MTIGNHINLNAMRLFDRDGDGGAEITAAIGLISDRVDFNTWRPVLPLGVRDVIAIVGREPVEALAGFYEQGYSCEALTFLQQAVALFSWLKIIPTLDAQHDNTGRARRIGENEKGLTALEQFKDEANIQRLAYEAVDALIESMERDEAPYWLESEKYRLRSGLLLQSKEHFDEFYTIGSHRLFVTLLPMIRETQSASVSPVVGRDMLAAMVAGHEPELAEVGRRAVALLSIKKAVERLPVEVLPEGIVQINQSAPVSQRLKAEKSARDAVAASLGADASRALQQLEDMMAERRAEEAPTDLFRPSPIVHSKGMTF